MNIIEQYILPRLPGVARLIAEDPDRNDFGFADFPTLIALLLFSIISNRGDRSAVIEHVERISAFDRPQIQFMLDQYEGREPRHHLWRRDGTGKYRLLI